MSSLCWYLYAQKDYECNWLIKEPDGSIDLVKNSKLVDRASDQVRMLVRQREDRRVDWGKPRGQESYL